MKIGLIDIGSNTSKLLIAEKKSPISNDRFSVLKQVSLPCRLLYLSPHHSGQIENRELQLLLTCLQDFKETCLQHEVSSIKTVATEAFRKATNSWAVRQKVKDTTGLEIEILSGVQEALGIAKGLQTDPQFQDWQNYIALDIGGGSVEVIEVVNQQPKQVKSLPIGAIRVAPSNQDKLESKINDIAQRNARKYVHDIVQTELSTFAIDSVRLAATGGTIVFLRKILENKKLLKKSGLIERSNIEQIVKEACSVSTEERILLFPDLPSDRADIFPYGLLAVLEIMKFLRTDQLTHSFHNLRYGLAKAFLDSLHQPQEG